METIKELSKEKKLKLLRKILRNYHRGYLCMEIGGYAYRLDYISVHQFYDKPCSLIAQALIPELLQFKPDNCTPDKAWFALPENEDAPDMIRKDVLKKLIKLIENSKVK
jgi:hypothetical protein